jgi:hypothetical protein
MRLERVHRASITESPLCGISVATQLPHNPRLKLLRFSERWLSWRVSGPGESHPEALSEPYVSVSAHTAPTIEPLRTSRQCANNAGARRDIRATHWCARR